MTDRPLAEVRADFDRIAKLDTGGRDHNMRYNRYLLRRVPRPCGETLEVGCGTGRFTRLLATRARRVTALDLSPAMIRVARERSTGFTGIRYEVADAVDWDYPASRFDCVVSIATLHHLPADAVLESMKRSLKPGGALLVLDLLEPSGVADLARSSLAYLYASALRLTRGDASQSTPELRRAWEEHGRSERYLCFREVQALRDAALPGAAARRHLLWRYSLVWRKPADDRSSGRV